MRLSGHHVIFTSFYALVMFATLVGFMPLQPSPSRISDVPINFSGRAFLVAEVTIFVVSAIFVSSKFIAYEHIFIPVDISFAAYAYALVLIVSLISNFRQLRREISTTN